jgi:hypothetical protein
MAKPGLSFENPLYAASGNLPTGFVNPYAEPNPAATPGFGGLQQGLADIAAMGAAARGALGSFGSPQPQAPQFGDGNVFFERDRRRFFVNGVEIDEQDDRRILESEALLGQPSVGAPTAGNWVPVPAETYRQIVQGVKQPSTGELFSRGFSIGAQQLKQLGGRALQLAGAEQLGGRIAESAEQRLEQLSPYQRQFTDAEFGSADKGMLDWIAASLGQAGPSILESVAMAIAGAAAGSAAAGPGLGTAGGAIAGFFGKKALKDKIVSAAAKYRTSGAASLSPAETQLLKNASAVAGAAAASFANSQVTGAADIYGEMREQGVGPEDFRARMTAIAGSFPYALAESSTEFLLAGRVLGGFMAPRPMAAGTRPLARGGEFLRRGAVGAAVGGTLEGATELGQEALVMGLSGQSLTDDAAVKRFINSFAAGAAVGGTLGGIFNLRGQNPDGTPSAESKQETNLLDNTSTATAARETQPLREQTELPLQGGMGVYGPSEFAPGEQPGSQGVLDVGLPTQPLSPQEVALRGQPPAAPAPEAAPLAVPQQMDLFAPQQPQQQRLDLAPPAPSGIGFTEQQPVPNTLMAQQMQIAQRRQQEAQAYQQAQQQQAAQREAELQQLAVQAQNQRQLDLAAQQAEPTPAPAPMPMRPAGPTQPVQLPLFTRRQAPRPSRAEGLRRGVGTRLPEPSGPVPLTAAERRRQGNLFTQEGQPTVAALKSAGKKTKVAKPAPKPRATQTAGARGFRRGARVSEVTVKEPTSAVQEPSPAPVSARKGAGTGQAMGAEVPAKQEVAGKGEALKAKTKKPAAKKPLKKEPPAPKAEAAPAAAPALPEKVPAKPTATPTAEALWNEERVPGDVAFADLPAAAKVAWEESDRSGAAQILILERLADDVLPMSTTERLNYNIARADEALKTGDTLVLGDAMDSVVEIAYFTDETQQAKPLVAEAQAYLNDTTFTDAQQNVINESFLLAAEGQSLDAYYKGGSKKGAITPWFEYASRQAGLIQRLAKANVTFSNMPLDKAKALLDNGMLNPDNLPDSTVKGLGKAKVKPEQAAGSKPQTSPAVKLAEKIKEINSYTGIPYSPAVQKKRTAELTALWKQVRDADLQTPEVDALLGAPLDSFFDADGKPIIGKVGGQLRVSNEAITPEVQAKREKAAAEGVVEDDTYEAPFTLDDWESARNIKDSDGRFSTADGKPIAKPVAVGRIRMAVNRFRSRLTVKPNIFVYANQADLKRRNPELYRQAAASRPEGDFDTANAAGVSFGRNIVIFSDRVATEDHLNFVLAHETVGHFGLRSLIPAKQFDALMLGIYDQSPAVRDGADAAMLTRDMGKAEAVEEYLSDFAAELDVSLIARIWNAIKGALNKLGVKFGDDAARYWVNQARRYVRNGEVGSAFNVGEVFTRMNALEGGLDPDNTGRFAITGQLRADNIALELMPDTVGVVPESLAEAAKRFRNLVGDSFDSMDKFKSRFFSLLNYRAIDNPGLTAFDRILSGGRNFAMSMKNAANEKMAVVLNRAVSIPGTKISFAGITDAQVDQVNEMLYAAQRYAVAKFKPADIGKTPLFSVAPDGTLVPNTTELDRVYNLGVLTFKQAHDGYKYEVTYEAGGKTVTEKVSVPGIADLDEEGPVWQGYLRTRETLRDVEIEMLRAQYLAVTQDRDLAFREIGDATVAKKLTVADQRFLERMYRKYRDLWVANQTTDEDGNPSLNPKSIEQANTFLEALNKTIILGEDRDYKALRQFFDGAADDAIASLDDFKTRFIVSEENKFLVQNRMKDIIQANVSNDGADLRTKITLAYGYAPLLRPGQHQTRLVAYNKRGQVVRLQQAYREQLIYSHFESGSAATDFAEKVNTELGGTFYEVMAYDENAREYVLMDVRLEAVAEVAVTELAAPPELNLNEFILGLRRFSIALPPQKLGEVIVALTRQNDSARNRLKRAFTPGANRNALEAMAKHIEARASVAAKILMRPKINELMNRNLTSTMKLWNGDKAKLDQLKANYDRVMADPTATVAERVQAKTAYTTYNFQYQTTNPEGKAGRGNQYYNEASSTLAFLDNNKNVDESDYGSGNIASAIRAFTSLLQLGGSIATGALNYVGVTTNGIPFLATQHAETGFGGGFGFSRSIAEFQRALSQVGLLRALPGIGETGLNTAEFYDKIAASKALQQQYGLTESEARFMASETREGILAPAQSNALLGTARGRITTGLGQKTIDGIMWTFNSTEQASRRGLGLAAYRLQYERSRAAGMTEADAAAAARDFAVNAVRLTVGDYSVLNRPPAWRTNLQSFLYMYKVFTTTSIQLLARLPRSGQVYMLGMLWLMGGLLATPFAEDLEDLLDTIAQGLGLRMPSVRAELAKTLDAIVPGISPYVLRGLVNAYFTGDFASRTSLGDFLPGSGMLLAGADVGRELTEIAGPAASMLTGVASSIPRFTQAAFTERVTLVDAFRESPMTMMRALGDTIAYGQAGAVIDKRGYVVSPDVSAGLMATRMLGFYPAAAAEQYDIIRVSKRITDYQKETVAGFRAAWIKGKLSNDAEQVRAIEQAVRDWNEGTKGSALEIRNFTANAQKALREAQRPAGERMLRAAPVAARSELEQIADLLGYND